MATNTVGHFIKHSQVSPEFLHSNSTSHTWIFSAFAELIDNAYDPDVNASQIWIDKKVINTTDCLVFMDNGHGMDQDKLHRMLSFGYCDKKNMEVKGHRPVGHYGNGFKSGSMRLGKDAIVFTKHKATWSVGLLSQTYLKNIGSDTVLVPLVTWDARTRKHSEDQEWLHNLQAITEHSLFQTEQELMQEFNTLAAFTTGTRIILYNLHRDQYGKLELDFESNPQDIINSETQMVDLSEGYRPVKEYQPEYRLSLRSYCSILFLKPRMKIVLRSKKVKSRFISKSLSKTEKDVYRPQWRDKPVKIILGFGPSKEDYGLMMYHKNRLIKAYERVGYQKQANELGVGVVGVVEVDFLTPSHNKQEFNKTDQYNACMNALASKLNDYWNEKMGNGHSAAPETQKPDWTWAQCDRCLKWRRMPDSVDGDTLPDKWFCYQNPDPMHNRCEIEEEPEDEDLLKATYEKTYKKAQEKEKQQKKASIQMQQWELQQKEKELEQKKLQMQRQKHIELENARKELDLAKRREMEQRHIIQQLQRQKNRVMKSISEQANMLSAQTHQRQLQNTASGIGSRKFAAPCKKTTIDTDEGEIVITENVSDSDEEGPPEKKNKKADSDDEDVIIVEAKNVPGRKRKSATIDIKPDVKKLEAANKASQAANKSGQVNELRALNNLVRHHQAAKDKPVTIAPKPSQVAGTLARSSNSAVLTVRSPASATSAQKNTPRKSTVNGSVQNNHVTPRRPSASASEAANHVAGDEDTMENGADGASNNVIDIQPVALVDQKPNINDLNKEMANSETNKKGSMMVHRLTQTLPMEQEGDKEMKKQLAAAKKEIKDTQERLDKLRGRVSDLLSIIVPDIDLGNLEYIDEIVDHVVQVNREQKS